MRYYLIFIISIFYFNKTLAQNDQSFGPLLLKDWEKLLFTHAPSTDNFFYLTNTPLKPEKELEALLNSFTKPDMIWGHLQEHPICSFPYRTKFIKRHFNLTSDILCPSLNAWKKSIAPKTISVVFSTSYFDNPSSMFGHTFLKFNKHPINVPHLNGLNYVGSYSAELDSRDSGLIYALKGIWGGYTGRFSLSPYYMKLREYVRAESRDLWEYELELSQEELDNLLDLYWELFQAGKFDYYFFTENCSLLLARILDLIIPNIPNEMVDVNFSKNYKLFVLPSEFIKKVSKSSRLKSVTVTPSYRRNFLGHYHLLNNSQKKEFKKTIQTHKLENTEALILRTLSEYYAYKKNDSEGYVDDTHKQREFEIRQKLASLNLSELPPPLVLPANNRPDLGHHQFMAGLGALRRENLNGVYLKTRFGFHDLYDNDLGYEAISDIQLLNSEISFTHKKFKIESFGIFQMISLPHYSYLDSRVSYKITTAFLRRNDSLTPYLEATFGVTFRNRYDTILTSFMMGGMTYFNLHSPLINIPIIFKTKNFSFGIENSPYYHTKIKKWGLREKIILRYHIDNNLSFEGESHLDFQKHTKALHYSTFGIRFYF